MAESAAGLVDHVFARVPVRQWVLSFPWPLRLLFAARPELLTRVLAVVTRALSTALARHAGLRSRAVSRSGGWSRGFPASSATARPSSRVMSRLPMRVRG